MRYGLMNLILNDSIKEEVLKYFYLNSIFWTTQ